jgi:hypothetical protein
LVPVNSYAGYGYTFNRDPQSWATLKFLKLSALKTAGAGWLVHDALVLTVDVTVEQEDRFQLDAGVPILFVQPCFRAAR